MRRNRQRDRRGIRVCHKHKLRLVEKQPILAGRNIFGATLLGRAAEHLLLQPPQLLFEQRVTLEKLGVFAA